MIVEEKKALDKNCCRDWKQPCCGSLCMAWRWAYDKVLKTTDDPDAPALEWFESVQSETRGYCGLAGRP